MKTQASTIGHHPRLWCLGVLFSIACSAHSATREQVQTALIKAVHFYHSKAAIHGGYVYHYSADFTLREAEGIPGPDTIWIQPPGTPGVGDAMMDAYMATGDKSCLRAAEDAANAVARCQHRSGGWDYSGVPTAPAATPITGDAGWHVWKGSKDKSTLDDDVTQSAIRLLLRTKHEQVVPALKTLMAIQYPNGAWSASFDSIPTAPPDEKMYPIKAASYPADWPRKWPKDFTGCYVLNDNLHARAMQTLLLAWKLTGSEAAKKAALRAADFLVLAQMPDPQPAWAQQYDAEMQPCWSRAFEPTSICGRESQAVMWALLHLVEATGEKKYLDTLPKACAYLDKSLLPNGKIARFYELQTNKPLYFERGKGGKGFELTYDGSNASSNYGWEWPSETKAIMAAHDALKAGKKPVYPKAELERWSLPPTDAEVDTILSEMNSEGAWIEKDGTMRNAEAKKVQPPGGVIHSDTFVQNVRALSSWLTKGTAP
jgi:PelA/Pel-15E family pectate lyase